MIYTYALLDLNTPMKLELNYVNICLLYKPYYIGKGTDGRILRHKYIYNTHHKKDAKTKQLLQNHSFDDISTILSIYNSHEEAYASEKLIIEQIGLDNLYNIEPGGRGGFGHRKNKNYDEIYGEDAENVKNKISQSNTGKKHSDERKQSKSEEVKKYFAIPENKKKHSEYLTGRNMPDSHKESASKRFKGIPKSEEHKIKISLSLMGRKPSEETKFLAAYNRSKHKYILNINNKKYLVIRSTGTKILNDLGFMGKFYTLVNKKYLKVNNIRVVIRKVERVRF